jgi:hypothetical protein
MVLTHSRNQPYTPDGQLEVQFNDLTHRQVYWQDC